VERMRLMTADMWFGEERRMMGACFLESVAVECSACNGRRTQLKKSGVFNCLLSQLK